MRLVLAFYGFDCFVKVFFRLALFFMVLKVCLLFLKRVQGLHVLFFLGLWGFVWFLFGRVLVLYGVECFLLGFC